jgi:hypothetical protein
MSKYWRDWISERFGDRSALPREVATHAFWDDLLREKLEEFFQFMEVEYSLDAGLLRPEDQLERLTAPIKTKNPLRWFIVEPRIEDAASELNYEIWKLAQTAGLIDRLPLFTVGEYVRVWCGKSP